MSKIAKPVVVLFDVDETLIHTGGAGSRTESGFEKLYGIPADIGEHSSAGKRSSGRQIHLQRGHRSRTERQRTRSALWPVSPPPGG